MEGAENQARDIQRERRRRRRRRLSRENTGDEVTK